MVTPIEVHFHIDVLDNPDHKVVVIEFKGELDESNIDETAKEIYKILDETPAGIHVIFDFADLSYMNSKSIGYLSDWFTKVNEKGAELLVANPKENITDILSTVGLDNFIKMYHTLDDAKLAILQDLTAKSKEASSSATDENTTNLTQ